MFSNGDHSAICSIRKLQSKHKWNQGTIAVMPPTRPGRKVGQVLKPSTAPGRISPESKLCATAQGVAGGHRHGCEDTVKPGRHPLQCTTAWQLPDRGWCLQFCQGRAKGTVSCWESSPGLRNESRRETWNGVIVGHAHCTAWPRNKEVWVQSPAPLSHSPNFQNTSYRPGTALNPE